MNIYIDAGTSNNGSPYQDSKICLMDGERIIIQGIGNCTNNEAEFHALEFALIYIEKKEKKDAHIYSDSQLVVKMANKEWKGKKKELRALALICNEKINAMGVRLSWIPREENKAGHILEKLYSI